MRNVLRKQYLLKIKPWLNKPVIKVLTGMRRVGKSYILRQIIEELKTQGVAQNNIVYIDKESRDFDEIVCNRSLNKYIDKNLSKNRKQKYIFIDEVQQIESWEKSVSSFLGEGYDVYITGSNASLLSSELATLVTGRYIEFKIYPLNFKEFLEFRRKSKTPQITTDEDFNLYLRYGGLPGIHNFELIDEQVFPYLSAIYDTVILKDVIKRYEVRNIELLERIVKFVFDNIGNTFSAKSLADFLKSQRIKVGVTTIQNQLRYLCSTHLIYQVPRYDLQGKKLLEINEKYFVNDLGIRHAVMGFNNNDIAQLLENVVLLELLGRDRKVNIGKLNGTEIDFIASNPSGLEYYQVAYLLATKETREREFAPLLKIKDNYPKFVLSMDNANPAKAQAGVLDSQGIRQLNILQFLMKS
jgi:predicted AAA+ superfamily ATPase